jgi:hypothetical protein
VSPPRRTTRKGRGSAAPRRNANTVSDSQSNVHQDNSQALDDDCEVLDGRAEFFGTLVVEVYAQRREDQRRRMRELAASSPNIRELYRLVMREALGGVV